MKKLDKFWVGFASGIVLPLIVFLVYYNSATKTLSVLEFLKNINSLGLTTQVLSSLAMPAFLLYYFAHQQHLDKAGRGIVGATLLITFALVLYSAFS